ncbi:hypothetical protein IP79_05835 [Porphyrobacter sp. AAP60]|nr:hypothetical protein IP79_05835 [Porphyrobacter sp. AAP60]
MDPDVDGLIDEEGGVWPSLRHYFWVHRLGMPGSGIGSVDRGCDVLLSVLHAEMNRTVGYEEWVLDLFGESWEGGRHYKSWLYGQGLLDNSHVTIEGEAAVRMLAATRPVDAPDIAPIDFAASWNGLDRGITRERREQVMEMREAMGRALRYRFVREPVAGKPGLKLIGFEMGNNIPLTRVLWTIAFPDDYARDRLFAWLADRLDRWQFWGEMAAVEGSRAFSEHLLRLRFADEPIDLA